MNTPHVENTVGRVLTVDEVAGFARSLSADQLAPGAHALHAALSDPEQVTKSLAEGRAYYGYPSTTPRVVWSYTPAKGLSDDETAMVRVLGDASLLRAEDVGPRPFRMVLQDDRLPEIAHWRPELHDNQYSRSLVDGEPLDPAGCEDDALRLVARHDPVPEWLRETWKRFALWHYQENLITFPWATLIDPATHPLMQAERPGAVFFSIGQTAFARARLYPGMVSLEGAWVPYDYRRRGYGHLLTVARLIWGLGQGRTTAWSVTRSWNTASQANLEAAGFTLHSRIYVVR